MPAPDGKGEENDASNYGVADENDGIRESCSDEEREIQMRRNLNTIDGVTLFSANASANDANVGAYNHQLPQPTTGERNQQEIINRANNIPAERTNLQSAASYYGPEDATARIENNQQETGIISKTNGTKISSKPTLSFGSDDDANYSEASRVWDSAYDAQVRAYNQMSHSRTSERNQQEIINNDSNIPADRINSQTTSYFGSDDVTACIGNTQRENDNADDVSIRIGNIQKENDQHISNIPGGKTSWQPTMSYGSDDDAKYIEARSRQILEYEQLNRAHIQRKNSESERKPAARVTNNTIWSQSTPSLTSSDKLANRSTRDINTPPTMRDTNLPAFRAQIRDTDSLAIQAQIQSYERLNQAHLRRSMSHINHNSPPTSGSKARHSSPESQSSRSLNALDGMDRSIASFGNESNNRNTQYRQSISEFDRFRQAARAGEPEMQMNQSQSSRSLEVITDSASRALEAQKLEYERLHQAHVNERQNRQGSGLNRQKSEVVDESDSDNGNGEDYDRKTPF